MSETENKETAATMQAPGADEKGRPSLRFIYGGAEERLNRFTPVRRQAEDENAGADHGRLVLNIDNIMSYVHTASDARSLAKVLVPKKKDEAEELIMAERLFMELCVTFTKAVDQHCTLADVYASAKRFCHELEDGGQIDTLALGPVRNQLVLAAADAAFRYNRLAPRDTLLTCAVSATSALQLGRGPAAKEDGEEG